MSVRLMTAVWDLDLPPGEKLVLLALADQANDEGRQCWPAVATIARRSGQGERTVRRALDSLETKGHLTRNHRDGTSTQYHVHPCHNDSPAKLAPLPNTTPTPAKLAPKPSRTIIEDGIKRTREVFPKPEGVDPQHWADFLANRKAKKLTNTATAHKRLMDDLARWSDDEWPPGRLIEHAAAKGWGGIYDPRQEQSNGRQPNFQQQCLRGVGRDPLLEALDRAREAERAERGGAAHHPGAWPQLPASGAGSA